MSETEAPSSSQSWIGAVVGTLFLCSSVIAFVEWSKVKELQLAANGLQVQTEGLRADVARVNEEANRLSFELRAFALLRQAKLGGEHTVSDDGRLEMYTWRNSDGQLCAHWCAHIQLSEPCQTLGKDACLP
jgi:hypothetical protein